MENPHADIHSLMPYKDYPEVANEIEILSAIVAANRAERERQNDKRNTDRYNPGNNR